MEREEEFAKAICRKIGEIAAETGLSRKEVAKAALQMIKEGKEQDRRAEELIIP